MNQRDKKARRRLSPEGLPIDPLAWTENDWRDCWRALKWLIRRIAKRHKPLKERKA